MASTGFFGLVWRFNALAIALAASGAIVAMAWMFGAIAVTYFRERPFGTETGLVDVGPEPEENATYSLGPVEEIEGANMVVHTLDRTSSKPNPVPIKSAYSYDREVVNLLMIDDETASGQWMFEGVGQAIFSRTTIYDPTTLGADKGKRRAIAMLFEVSTRDTNKDGRIDWKDDGSLMTYRLADGARQELLKGSFWLTAVRQAKSGKVLVTYEQGEKTILASYSPDDFRLLARNELPRLSTRRTTRANSADVATAGERAKLAASKVKPGVV